MAPETALVYRVYAEYCVEKELEDKIVNVFPTLTLAAEGLEELYSKLSSLRNKSTRRRAGEGSRLNERVFIVGELMKLALQLDGSDAHGCEMMVEITSEIIHPPLEGDVQGLCILSIPEKILEEDALPIPLLDPCIELLHKASGSDRQFFEHIVPIIDYLRNYAQGLFEV